MPEATGEVPVRASSAGLGRTGPNWVSSSPKESLWGNGWGAAPLRGPIKGRSVGIFRLRRKMELPDLNLRDLLGKRFNKAQKVLCRKHFEISG